MSGWDATSRPTWDPQGGTGEHTQSFGAPDFADDAGFPNSASPGTPPAIFLQDYDKNDFAQGGFGQSDYGRADTAAQSHLSRGDFGQNDFRQNDFGQHDFGQNDFGTAQPGRDDFGQNAFPPDDFGQGREGQGHQGHGDFGQNDFRQNDFGQNDFGRSDLGQNDFGQNDFGQGDFRGSDFGQQDRGVPAYRGDDGLGRPAYDQPGPRDYAQQDFPRRDPRDDVQWQPGAGTGAAADRDYAARDFQDVGRERRDDGDTDFAARMDPALRDFFAPQSARQDPQPGYGQPRQGSRGYPAQDPGQAPGHNLAQGRGGQFGPGLSNGHRQPGGPGGPGGPVGPGGPGGQGGPPRWDTSPQRPQRPGPRSTHRQESRADRRGLTPAAIAIGLVVVLGIAIGAYMLLRGKPAAPAASSGNTPLPSASATHKSTAKTQIRPAADAADYTLKTPATAGGYPKMTAIPSGVHTAAGNTAQAIKTAVTSAGAKVTSEVTAAYQLSSGQVLAFTGFEGTFNPTKVMATLATFGTDSHVAAAGPHGGELACATTPSPNGTVCVWVTTTTLGITEFFASSDLPEVVTVQSKAASDTLKFRASVEVPKP
jgi:hypothetical protein